MTDSDIRREILDEIARRAPHYTPEWRYNPQQPDAGTALAMLWADMYAGSLERYGLLAENFRRALLDAIGSEPRKAAAASGFLAFAAREGAGDFIIPKGTIVAAPKNPETALETCCDLAAGSAAVSDIYRTIPSLDMVKRYDALRDIDLSDVTQGAEHIWTFEHGFALNVSQAAALRLTVGAEDGAIAVLAESNWEYRDGEAWHNLAVIRDGDSLLYIFPKEKERCDALRVSVNRDAVLRDLTAKPSGKGMFPDALYADGSQVHDGFYPFGQRFIPGMCAYFSNTDALTKPGAEIELTFTLSFDEFEIEGYAEPQVYMRKIMRTSELKPPEEYTISAAQTKWEYYNGVGWAALEVNADTSLFGGGISGRIRIAFSCPDDIHFTVVGAHDLPFIRVRLVAADNLYRQRGHYKTPHISDIRFSYRYGHGVPITDIKAAEHLDTFNKTLPVSLAAPPAGPAALYFASDCPFTRGTILFHLRRDGARAGVRWEYLSDTGWTALGGRDDTDGLRKTGILHYQTSRSAARVRLWGRTAYWIRLVLDSCGRSDTYLYGLYENAVRAAATVPGAASIQPAGSFTTIITPLNQAESAHNPIAISGGADAEDETGVIARMSAELTHYGRVVSGADCEALAMEASPRIKRVKYYPNTDVNGAYAYGQSCLEVYAPGTEEYGFEELRDEIMAFIMPCRPLSAEKLSIIPMRRSAANVTADIITNTHYEPSSVKKRGNSATLRQNNLDDMRFDGIVQSALRSIGEYYPQWSDINTHDPGVTLIELFAWLTEQQRFYMDQSEDAYSFFPLLGIRLRRASAAETEIEIPGGYAPRVIPAKTPLYAEKVRFETVRDILYDGTPVTIRVIQRETVNTPVSPGKAHGYPGESFFADTRGQIILDFALTVSGETWVYTDGFRASQPDDKHYTLNHETGEITFGDGIHGALPYGAVVITDMSLTRGPDGNIASDRLTELANLPVIQPRAAAGGTARETISQALRRYESEREQAVTARDIERLVLKTPGLNIIRAHAYSSGSVPVSGKPRIINIAVVPGDGVMTEAAKQKVLARLEPYRLVGREFIIEKATRVHVALNIEIHAQPHSAHFKDELETAVRSFFKDKYNNFGSILHISDFCKLVTDFPGVKSVTHCAFRAYGDGKLSPDGNIMPGPGAIAELSELSVRIITV